MDYQPDDYYPSDNNNWNVLLETPPGWCFVDSASEGSTTYNFNFADFFNYQCSNNNAQYNMNSSSSSSSSSGYDMEEEDILLSNLQPSTFKFLEEEEEEEANEKDNNYQCHNHNNNNNNSYNNKLKQKNNKKKNNNSRENNNINYSNSNKNNNNQQNSPFVYTKAIPSNGTFAIKAHGFVPDSIKFEYYFNEIPSRCIMLSNISPDATKDDLIYIFESFGEYESCDLSKLSSGVALVQFYSMEDAQAMRVSNIYVCNKLVILIFHIESQTNQTNSKRPPNNGTIVLFHLPKDINEMTLHEIFSKFGKIRQIRHTPSKESQKFIEFYDTRAAEKALKTFNGKPLNKQFNSRVSIEYSLPGGFKKNLQKFYRTTLPTIVRSNNNRVSY